MIKLRRISEAIQTSDLSKKCREVIKTKLGVIPFPLGENSLVLKAVYFRFILGQPEIAISEDVILDIDENSITVGINKSCMPNGNFVEAFVEDLSPQYPLIKALPVVCDRIAVEVQKTGQSWCRVGYYKTLNIASPYIDRLKAFSEMNPEVRMPSIAIDQMARIGDSPDYMKAINALSEEPVLTQSEVSKINKKMQDLMDNFGASISRPDIEDSKKKSLTDRQMKNRVARLTSKDDPNDTYFYFTPDGKNGEFEIETELGQRYSLYDARGNLVMLQPSDVSVLEVLNGSDQQPISTRDIKLVTDSSGVLKATFVDDKVPVYRVKVFNSVSKPKNSRIRTFNPTQDYKPPKLRRREKDRKRVADVLGIGESNDKLLLELSDSSLQLLLDYPDDKLPKIRRAMDSLGISGRELVSLPDEDIEELVSMSEGL